MKIKEMGLSKTQPQQIGKDCFKSAYCYNCHSHCVKNSYLHSKPACNCLLFPLLFAENETKWGRSASKANLITLKTQSADYHAHLDTVKITCELEPQKSSLVHK